MEPEDRVEDSRSCFYLEHDVLPIDKDMPYVIEEKPYKYIRVPKQQRSRSIVQNHFAFWKYKSHLDVVDLCAEQLVHDSDSGLEMVDHAQSIYREVVTNFTTKLNIESINTLYIPLFGLLLPSESAVEVDPQSVMIQSFLSDIRPLLERASEIILKLGHSPSFYDSFKRFNDLSHGRKHADFLKRYLSIYCTTKYTETDSTAAQRMAKLKSFVQVLPVPCSKEVLDNRIQIFEKCYSRTLAADALANHWSFPHGDGIALRLSSINHQPTEIEDLVSPDNIQSLTSMTQNWKLLKIHYNLGCITGRLQHIWQDGLVAADSETTTSNQDPLKDLSDCHGDNLRSTASLDGLQPFKYWKLAYFEQQLTGRSKVIAIIDSGIDESHPAFYDYPEPSTADNYEDLAADEEPDLAVDLKIIKAFCVYESTTTTAAYAVPKDYDGHGTKCAGVACGLQFMALTKQEAYSRNGYHSRAAAVAIPQGVARNAKLIVIKVDQGQKFLHAALEKLNNMIQGDGVSIDVVSISLGMPQYSRQVEAQICKLVGAGIPVVCAASNDGQKYKQSIRFPSLSGHTICIGAHDANGEKSGFSPVGQQIDFLAPGENIICPSPYGGYSVESGTSFAAPAVAGLICLISECIDYNTTTKFKEDLCHHCDILIVFKDDSTGTDARNIDFSRTRICNQWIVKEILRGMATNSEYHLRERGYGSLDPEPFFRQPEAFIRQVFKMYN